MKDILIYIFSLFLCIQITLAQKSKVYKIPSEYTHIKDSVHFTKALYHLVDLLKNGYTEKGKHFANHLIKEGAEINYLKGIGNAYLQKGRTHGRTKEYLEAVESYDNAEKYYKKVQNVQGLALVYNDRFILEQNKGNIEKSSDHLLQAKMYYEKVADSSGLVIVYNNLGSVYATLKNYKLSEEFFSKAITIRKKIGDLKNIGLVMNNLAFIYIQNKKPNEAKEILNESLIINRKDSLIESVAHSYSIMGEVALSQKDYETAEKYFDTTLQVSSQTNFDLLTIDTKQQLGYLAIHAKDYKKSEELLRVAREGFTDLHSIPLLLKNYQFSSKLDSARGNLAGALAWQKEYQKLSDERMSEMSTKKIETAEARYQAELNHLRKIDAQEKREQRSKEELFRYRIFTFIILGVLLVSLLFLFWVIRTRKERKKLINKLNDSNQIKNKLFSIISHDLKNEVHGLESSLNMMKDNEITPDEFEEIIPLLANRTNQTSILLNNLLNWSKSQMNELNAKPVKFDVTELISTKFAFFKPKAAQKNIQLINKLDTTEIYADKDMVGIVAQNLIANAIKFCKSGDSIALISKERDDHYEIGFADTGVGIDPENINKLFAEETFTTNGTQNESGTGLGLRICKELIELNNGNIKVESTLGQGSTFFISLPKAAA